MDNMKIYKDVAVTPSEAKKSIEAGRLKGFTDINPMWRIKRLTELFGACGIGWWTEVVDRWSEQGANDEVKAFVRIKLYIKCDGVVSQGIEGIGGSSFVAKERAGLYTSDEAYKMAFTDALGSACKMLGMSADIYYSKDRTKYTSLEEEEEEKEKKKPKSQPKSKPHSEPQEKPEQTMLRLAKVVADGTEFTPQQICDMTIKNIVEKTTGEVTTEQATAQAIKILTKKVSDKNAAQG